VGIFTWQQVSKAWSERRTSPSALLDTRLKSCFQLLVERGNIILGPNEVRQLRKEIDKVGSIPKALHILNAGFLCSWATTTLCRMQWLCLSLPLISTFFYLYTFSREQCGFSDRSKTVLDQLSRRFGPFLFQKEEPGSAEDFIGSFDRWVLPSATDVRSVERITQSRAARLGLLCFDLHTGETERSFDLESSSGLKQLLNELDEERQSLTLMSSLSRSALARANQQSGIPFTEVEACRFIFGLWKERTKTLYSYLSSVVAEAPSKSGRNV
jgi:hypothetical protein